MKISDKKLIDEYYRAILNKAVEYEGVFITAVKTTGIFCRPICTARKPKKENVVFFTTTEEAIFSNYRACKVCRPLEKLGETPAYIKKLLQEISDDYSVKIKDSDLLQKGIEPSKVRRWFLKNHGMTFHAYQRVLRLNAAFQKIQSGESVISTAFETGYESLSGFTDSFKSMFGMPPSNIKKPVQSSIGE
jgi:AraC family transcriptional regulator of adaptative response/methylated-DNA-[protein]-cysteine methyltransferase